MTVPRRQIVSVSDTPYYHVICRCVRRAFLCGLDAASGKDYEHRRAWVLERLEELSEIFTIDVCAYSVMSNHTHLVVRLDPKRAEDLDDDEVVHRWERLYGIPDPIRIGRRPEAFTEQVKLAKSHIDIRRKRLGDLSWFMKCLNEHIARRANAEDRCTGAFWEGRFKSQALLDERALLTCMAYVDLNPIRAKMAECLEGSDYTSVQQRIRSTQGHAAALVLQRFRDELGDPENALPFYLRHYLELVDWTGRVVLPNKRGAIPAHVNKILDKLGFDEHAWLAAIELYKRPVYPMIGSAVRIREAARNRGRSWFRGTRECGGVFGLP